MSIVSISRCGGDDDPQERKEQTTIKRLNCAIQDKKVGYKDGCGFEDE